MKPTQEELDDILRKHKLWLEGEEGGEQADLSYADLSFANLSFANLSSAYLRSADLSYSDLSSANLSSANLRSTNLRSADFSYAVGTYYIRQRTDGCQFFLCEDQGKHYIRAGCRYLSIADYRKHAQSYKDESKREETLLILDCAEAKLNSILKKSEAA